MYQYEYSAKSVDGSRNTKGGSIIAANKEEATKAVKAQFSYPVTVEFWMESYFPDKPAELPLQLFHYDAYARDGSRDKDAGSVEAVDEKDAEKKARARYSYPVDIRIHDDLDYLNP